MAFQSNFFFLKNEYPILANLGEAAERYANSDPSVSVTKIRIFGERMTDLIFREHRLSLPRNSENTFAARLQTLQYEDCVARTILDLLHLIRSKGNIAVHDDRKIKPIDALEVLETAHKLAYWFQQSYGTEGVSKSPFVSPPKVYVSEETEKLNQDLTALSAQFEAKLAENQSLQNQIQRSQNAALQAKIKKATASFELSEAETRHLIDEQLRNAGWEADTTLLNFKTNGTMPEDGRKMAIAEWKCGTGWADYALFVGKKLLAVVEAKKFDKDISSDLRQSNLYHNALQSLNVEESLPRYGNTQTEQAPFIFSTNGREHNPFMPTKSGIWFQDMRISTNLPRALRGWFSPQGLLDLASRNEGILNQKLENEDFAYLTQKGGLGLRPYQVQAIQAVENSIIENPEKRSVLLAMATGTGKTRTILGLCYRLLKTERFKRILFLVDRTVLGGQSKDVFDEVVVDGGKALGKIYKTAGFEENTKVFNDNLKEQGKAADTTRIYFSTVQGMVHRLFSNTNPAEVMPVDTYDCIIIDEAHRGYLLDKEMDENQVEFRDHTDFISQYRRVLDYFDAFKVGLTATPAKHTSEIFGGYPIFNYSYRQAVLDGFLVDFDAPIIIKTKLNEDGIQWKKGEKPKTMDKTGKITELAELEDDLKFDVDTFNKQVLTPSFNETVAAELVQHIDTEGKGKTLIFAVDNTHADLIVTKLQEAYQTAGFDLDLRTILKITGKVYKVEDAISNFKNEKYPNIVVTVDLLTTGIDVPEISNLVFMRRVNSRILYEQMLGRATRLCPDIGKESFRVFDAVRLYEALQEFTDIKPLVNQPNVKISELAATLTTATNDKGFSSMLEELVAKMQRKKQVMTDEQNTVFSEITEGVSLTQFIDSLKTLKRTDAEDFIKKSLSAFAFLEKLKGAGNKDPLFSEEKDEIRSVEFLYGEKHSRPEDYLDQFIRYLDTEKNKNLALQVVLTRPQTLTRAELKSLRAELDAAKFPMRQLNAAFKNAKNVDIAADIVGMIRSLMLGDTLISKSERIDKAMKEVWAAKKWTNPQEGWLKRIEKRLRQENNDPILDEGFFASDEVLKDNGGFKRFNLLFNQEGAAVIQLFNEYLLRPTA